MAGRLELREFPDRVSASQAAAEFVAESIRTRLATRERCSVVVSGGSTPGPCFDALSEMPLEWSRVTVVPSDERWVPPDHPDSNEKLVRERLLVSQAAAGQFLPFYRKGMNAAAAVPLIEQNLARHSATLNCALLGMGEDGHFASLFPDFDRLEQGLNPAGEAHCLLVRTASSPHARISLSLSFILQAEAMLLLIFGDAKRRVLEAAVAGDASYPISSLVRYGNRPLTVAWAL